MSAGDGFDHRFLSHVTNLENHRDTFSWHGPCFNTSRRSPLWNQCRQDTINFKRFLAWAKLCGRHSYVSRLVASSLPTSARSDVWCLAPIPVLSFFPPKKIRAKTENADLRHWVRCACWLTKTAVVPLIMVRFSKCKVSRKVENVCQRNINSILRYLVIFSMKIAILWPCFFCQIQHPWQTEMHP